MLTRPSANTKEICGVAQQPGNKPLVINSRTAFQKPSVSAAFRISRREFLPAKKKGSPPMQIPTGIVLRCTADLVPYANNARTHTPEQVKQIASASEKNTPPGLRKLRALRRADRDWGERTGVVRHLGRDQAFHAEGGVGGRVRRRGGCTPAHICAVITGSEPIVFTPDNSCKKSES